MSILKIARMGHPVLRAPAEPVTDPTAPEIRRLIADMMETLADARGRGLAAPQVHVARRLVIFHVPGEPDDDGEDRPSQRPSVLVNPVVEPVGEEVTVDWEGCLSLPSMMGLVPRTAAIRYTGVDENGTAFERHAEGFHARVVQHECDHLDGILYPQRMPDLSLLGFVDEIRQAAPPRGQNAEDDEAEN